MKKTVLAVVGIVGFSGVLATCLLYTSKATITHEYQCDYQTKEAKQCYQETVQFVNTYK